MQYNAECARLGCGLRAVEDCAIKMAERRDASENGALSVRDPRERQPPFWKTSLPEEPDDFYVKFISDDIQ